MSLVAAPKPKNDLTLAAEQVRRNGRRRPIPRKGRIIAALVPPNDLETLEWMDRMDIRAARRVLADAHVRWR